MTAVWTNAMVVYRPASLMILDATWGDGRAATGPVFADLPLRHPLEVADRFPRGGVLATRVTVARGEALVETASGSFVVGVGEFDGRAPRTIIGFLRSAIAEPSGPRLLVGVEAPLRSSRPRRRLMLLTLDVSGHVPVSADDMAWGALCLGTVYRGQVPHVALALDGGVLLAGTLVGAVDALPVPRRVGRCWDEAASEAGDA